VAVAYCYARYTVYSSLPKVEHHHRCDHCFCLYGNMCNWPNCFVL